MSHGRKYARLLAVQVRASVLLALQYRLDAAFDAAVELFYATTALVPLLVIFGTRGTVAGWSYPASLLVVGWFTLLQTILDGIISPGLTAVVEHVRKGTLDFILLKPADAEFLVSTTRFQPTRATNVITAGLIFAYAFHKLGHGPSPGGIAFALVLLVLATLVLHSFLMMAIAASFYVVRIDNLAYVFTSVYDAARWPRSVFRGVAHVVFTFVLPFAMMTSYPVEALLGELPVARLLFAALGTAAFVLLARLIWLRALSRYTSASS